MTRSWDALLPRLERVLDQLEDALARSRDAAEPAASDADADKALAFRWRGGALEPIAFPDVYPLDALVGVERSVARLRANIAAFTRAEPALDVLLYGERGTGKSSAVRGLLGEFAAAGFRLVEVRREALLELPSLWRALRRRRERFGVFCDDLSFEAGDTSWKLLKAELDGGLEARPGNALILATSNRRHLLPEYLAENREARLDADGLLHPGETAEEKVSLSDRFGLLLPFFAFDQDTYLRIVALHARALGLGEGAERAELEAFALRFALERGTRSGRTARQACIAFAQSRGGPGSAQSSAQTATLRVACPDRPGLVAALAQLLHDHGANILEAQQHLDVEERVFTQRIHFDLAELDIARDQLEALLAIECGRYQMRWRISYSDRPKRVAIFVSKFEHCLYDLLIRHRLGELRCEIPLIVSNHPDLAQIAAQFGVAFHVFEITKETKAAQEARELELLARERIDLVVLARYMQVLSESFIARHPERIINIHHSTLPAFSGARPYHQAFERGVKRVGATAHYATSELDEGPIIEQDVVAVSHRDTVLDLVRKGRDVERMVLARAVHAHLEDRIIALGRRTVVF